MNSRSPVSGHNSNDDSDSGHSIDDNLLSSYKKTLHQCEDTLCNNNVLGTENNISNTSTRSLAL